MIYKTPHRKQKDRATRTPQKPGVNSGPPSKGKQFLLNTWHPSCYSFYKHSDKSWMRKGPDCDYDKQNISGVICDTDTSLNFDLVMCD